MGRRSRTTLSSVAAALLTGALLGAPSAHAQSDEQRAGARAAANAGGQAFMQRRYADAVDMFTRAESLVHSPVHLLYLARSYEKLGALVKAHEAYMKIVNEELPSTATPPMREAKADATKENEALEPRIPYVSVVVQGAGPKPVTVTMDGVQVPPALVGVPRPVDPGEHRFEAMADGMESAVSSVAVREAGSETVLLTLHPAPQAAGAPAAGAGAPAAPGTFPVGYAPGVQPQQDQPASAHADSSRGPSPLTWVAFGVGAVGLGLGTVFAIKESSKESDANDSCRAPLCTADQVKRAEALDDQARSARTVSIVGFVAGGVGVATGIALLALTPHHASRSASTLRGVTPWVGLGSAGVSGRF